MKNSVHEIVLKKTLTLGQPLEFAPPSAELPPDLFAEELVGVRMNAPEWGMVALSTLSIGSQQLFLGGGEDAGWYGEGPGLGTHPKLAHAVPVPWARQAQMAGLYTGKVPAGSAAGDPFEFQTVLAVRCSPSSKRLAEEWLRARGMEQGRPREKGELDLDVDATDVDSLAQLMDGLRGERLRGEMHRREGSAPLDRARTNYSFAVHAQLVLGEEKGFLVRHHTLWDFLPSFACANVVAEGFVKLEAVTIDGRDVPELSHHPDGSWRDAFDLSVVTSQGASRGAAKLGEPVECRHGVAMIGRYTGLVPPGYQKGSPYLFCLTLQGPALAPR